MAGAYIGWVLATATSNLLLAFVGAIVGVALVGVLVERLTFRYVRDESHLVPLVMSLGLSTMLSECFRLLFYPGRPVPYPEAVRGGETLTIFGFATISTTQLIALAIAAGMAVSLHALVYRTRLGIALRATAENLRVARLMGVNDNRIASITFALAGGLAGAAGVCFGLIYAGIDPYVGGPLGIKAVLIVVFAGLGNMFGALFGALLFGLAGVMSVAYGAPGWSDFFAYLAVVLVLLVKPNGIFGSASEQAR
jgi:branched-chain amino acid transport system permease protein